MDEHTTGAAEAAYEPPQVSEVSSFAELTSGNIFAGTSDDGSSAGYYTG